MADMCRHILSSQGNRFAFFGFKHVLSTLGLYAAFQFLLAFFAFFGLVLTWISGLIFLAHAARTVSRLLRFTRLLSGLAHAGRRYLRSLSSNLLRDCRCR